MNPVATDAELACRYAIEVLEQGRYALGAELARIARNAAFVNRNARADIVCGICRTEYATEDAAIACARDCRKLQETAAMTSVGITRIPPAPMSHAPQTCRAAMQIDVSVPGRVEFMDGAACNAPIVWQPGLFGDGNVDPETAGWQHLDPKIDNNHVPIPAT